MADYTAAVEKFYVEYFLRPADVAGLQYWNNVFNSNPNAAAQISAEFAQSAEYKSMYAGMDNTAIVQAIYQNLFGRPGEASGVSYWVDLLNRDVITVNNMVDQVAAGAQGSDKVVLNGRVSVATVFTQHLDTPAEQQAYAGPAALKIAKDFLGGIVDLGSGAAASQPSIIDDKIAQIVGTHTAADGADFIA